MLWFSHESVKNFIIINLWLEFLKCSIAVIQIQKTISLHTYSPFKLVFTIEQKIKPNEQGNFGDDRVIMLTNPAQSLIKSLLTN